MEKVKILELNKEYTYPQICEIVGWKKQSNESKDMQIRAIESAYEFYHPISKKTHKEKKSYMFTKKLHEIELIDGRKNNGAKLDFPQEEFDYLLNCILKKGIERNEYFHMSNECPVYVSNTVIYDEFGFDCYGLLDMVKVSDEDKDEVIFKNLFQQIVFQSVKSKTITKVCKKFGYKKNAIPKGILRNERKYSRTNKNVVTTPDDELLDTYNDYEKEFIEDCGFKNIADVINNGLYKDMLQYIKGEFEEKKLYGVKKLNRIYLPDDVYNEVLHFQIDTKTKEKYQEHFKEIILDSIEKSVLNRIYEVKDYSFKTNDKQKEILKDYFEQLSGRQLEITKSVQTEMSNVELSDEDVKELNALFDGKSDDTKSGDADKSDWGESDPMENNYSIEEILDMDIMSNMVS